MPNTIIDFWFNKITPSKWWVKDEGFDAIIRERFINEHQAANQCELYHWRETAEGRLAEIIILDQFSRNIFRDTPLAFASDSLALALAQEAVSLKVDKQLNDVQRNFLYMPYMHSESIQIHQQAVLLFGANKENSNLDYELKHKAIIERYNRYPHRNKILGRTSTPEEVEFLTNPGSSF